MKAQQVLDLHRDPPVDQDDAKGLWIYGPHGSGKSFKANAIARKQFGEQPFTVEEKLWFDGYVRQKVIHIEDLDKKTAYDFSHFIKLLA